MSAVCGLRFTDFKQVAFSCKQRLQFISIAPNKATKQSRDLSVCLLLIINNTSRSWLNENAMFIKVLNKILMLKERQCVYYSAITNTLIPDSLLNSETQASSYHLKRSYFTGWYDLELWP